MDGQFFVLLLGRSASERIRRYTFLTLGLACLGDGP